MHALADLHDTEPIWPLATSGFGLGTTPQPVPTDGVSGATPEVAILPATAGRPNSPPLPPTEPNKPGRSLGSDATGRREPTGRHRSGADAPSLPTATVDSAYAQRYVLPDAP